jgi:hypothetical protein
VQIKIDLSNVEPANDETSECVDREREMMDRAILGYAQMDVLEADLVFRQWNVRTVNPTEVQKIVDSMRLEGIQRYRPKSFFSVVVRREDVDVSKLSNTADMGAKLPNLASLFKGKADKIIACGGQHRKTALKQVYDQAYKEAGKPGHTALLIHNLW